MKCLFIRELFHHMGKYSGYDILFNKLNDSELLDCSSAWVKQNNLFWKGIRKIYKMMFKVELAESLSWNKALNSDIVHVGFIERNFNLFQKLKSTSKFKGKVVATIHQPQSWWKVNGADPSIVKHLDALIVMSRSQINFLSKYLPKEKIYFIPHGIDHHFFKPNRSLRKKFKVVFSGKWLRNLDALYKVVELTLSKHPDICFDLIYPKSFGDSHEVYGLLRHDNVNLLSGLTDNELLNTYQSSSLMFLPMYDCTANNAILEGMACGLPIITSDIEGIKSYVDESFTDFFHNYDAEGMSNSISRYYLDSQLLASSSENARRHVEENLTWEIVQKQTTALYKIL